MPLSIPTPALSVVIPCYNEQETLHELYRRVTAACVASTGSDYEIVLVNDGSRDATWDIMNLLAGEDAHIVAVNLSRNYGHQIALSAGLSTATGNRVFILDADLQDPPELLRDMMVLMDKGADVVYGKRVARDGETWFKRTTSRLFYRLLGALIEVGIPVDTGDFRLMSRRAVDLINKMPERSRYIRGMVSWIGLTQVALPFHREPRYAGKTNYPLHKMLRLAIDAITSFSTTPLHIASYVGALLGIAGIAMIFYTLGIWITGRTVQGWTSLMIIVLVIGSAQLLTLGIFGEYLGRMYMEAKQRPLFIVEKTVRKSTQKPDNA